MQNLSGVTQRADNAIVLPNDIAIISAAGTPTNGTTGAGFAGPGSLYINLTTGKHYVNSNTKASPTWGIVTSA